jgi:hypothetical protein
MVTMVPDRWTDHGNGYSDGATRQRDDTDRITLSQQRNGEQGAEAALILGL